MLACASYPRDTDKNKRPTDINQLAHFIGKEATKESSFKPSLDSKHTKEKNPFAVALRRLGASKGGKIRAEKLSKKRRHQIAQNAAEAGVTDRVWGIEEF